MNSGTVKKRTLRKSEIGYGVPVIEAFHVGPVLLGVGRSRRPALSHVKRHRTVERIGEDFVAIASLTGGYAAVRQGNSDRRQASRETRRLNKASTEVEESWPFSWVLGGRDLLIGAVHQRVSTISKQSAFRDFCGVQFLSHHGLDWVSPDRNNRTKFGLRCI